MSTVQYAREVHGIWCQCSAHEVIVSSSVFFFWFFIEYGSSISSSTAVRMASNASCFALLNPTKGIFLGNQSSLMLRLGYASMSSLILVRQFSVTACSSWGVGSRTLLIAKLEERKMRADS